MIAPSRRAGAALLRRRLQGYVEYAELLAEQEQAADAGDLERFEDLGKRLDELQAALGGLPSASQVQDTEDPETQELLTETTRVLEQASQVQQRIAATLRIRRNQTRDELRALEGRSDQVRSYIDRNPSGGGRLNVRF